jgi:small-conductance mechanosensitive channel
MAVPGLDDALAAIPMRYWLALAVLVLGVVLAYLVGIVERRLLKRAGFPDAIEGTAFERTARELGTSTVSILAKLGSYFVLIFTVFIALTVAQVGYAAAFWSQMAAFLPRFLFALVVLVIAVIVGDKVELIITERVRGVKLPQITVVATLAKWTVVYVGALIALALMGVPTLALIVLLGAYVLALIVFGALAFGDMLASAAAGLYLLLEEPYGIGDEVQIGDRRGIVQETQILVTYIESDGEVHVVPNRLVFQDGIVRYRD